MILMDVSGFFGGAVALLGIDNGRATGGLDKVAEHVAPCPLRALGEPA